MNSNPLKPERQISGCMDFAVLALLSIFTGGVVIIRHLVTLGFSIAPENPYKTALIGVGVQFLLLTPILAALAFYWPTPRRLVYRAWLIVNILTFLLSPAYLINPTATSAQTAFQIAVGMIVFILLIIGLSRFRKSQFESSTPPEIPSPTYDRVSSWINIRIIMFLGSFGWLAQGALGSPFETILMVLIGLIIGLIAQALIREIIRSNSVTNIAEEKNEILLTGIGISTTLLMLAGSLSFPFGGIQLILILSVPGLGWMIAWMNHAGMIGFHSHEPEDGGKKFQNHPAWRITILTGWFFALPIMFFDPEEMTLVLNLSPGEIFQKALLAAFISIAAISLLILISVMWGLIRRKKQPVSELRHSSLEMKSSILQPRALILGLAIISAVWIFFRFGQPGFHGEKIFVVFKNQADLTEMNQNSRPQ